MILHVAWFRQVLSLWILILKCITWAGEDKWGQECYYRKDSTIAKRRNMIASNADSLSFHIEPVIEIM